MPDAGDLALFLAAALVVAVTPGPAILYVAARTLAGGRGEGLASSLGTGLGGLFHVPADAPGPFIEAQLRGIVGVEIEIARSEGKWKVSQNRPVVDRVGVVEGLDAAGRGATAGAPAMADLVRSYGGLG